MSVKARIYFGFITAAGAALLFAGILPWESRDPFGYLCYLVVALSVAGLKLSVPAVRGAMPAALPFVLFGILDLTRAETVLLATLVTALECYWNAGRKVRLRETIFAVASIAISTIVTADSRWDIAVAQTGLHPVVLLIVMAGVFFALNTFQSAAAIALGRGRPLLTVWYEGYFWSFPYYLAGAAIAGLMSLAHQYAGWQTSLLVIPVIFLIHRSYRGYLDRLVVEKMHAGEIAALHLRTIEALALAIEAKDDTTREHLRRVEVYAVGIARELGLPDMEIEAVRAAALLHDIGKLAVPEHIVSKPGRLTPEEFEKLKIHPVAGAEILERVRFPYPVAPIVRAHHEKWNGTGYPRGLRGEQIPIGARILAAVDCLDAMTRERQYREALPLDEAMQAVREDAGVSFDPLVVEVLSRRYRELETLARVSATTPDAAIEAPADNGAQPVAACDPAYSGGFIESIAAARQEAQTLFELAQDLGSSLSLDETLSVLALRLRRIVPWDSMAIFIRREDLLVPEYVSGGDFRLISSLEIPLGQGLSGWVAAKQTPVVNGNPAAETAHLKDSLRAIRLQSALSVPLLGIHGVVGVLTLYRTEPNAFRQDHLRILLAIGSKVALSIENAMRFRQAESSATTDYLTALPNARSLFLHLDGELARARRSGTPVAVVVCDLDGFKQVNDRHGHLEGNRVLKDVAAGLKEACREYDYVARMGGDEFVIVLPGMNQEALGARLEAFRAAVRKSGRTVCGMERLGLSAGHAFFPVDGNDAEQLLADADRRMYREKRQSKQRVEMSLRLLDLEAPTTAVQ